MIVEKPKEEEPGGEPSVKMIETTPAIIQELEDGLKELSIKAEKEENLGKDKLTGAEGAGKEKEEG